MDEEIKEEIKTEDTLEEETAAEETEKAAAANEPQEEQGDKKPKNKDEKKYKAKCAALEKELEELKAKLDTAKDAHLRIAAEYENFRKRTQKEKEGIYSDAVGDTLKVLLPLFDDFDRAAAFSGDSVDEGLSLILKSVPGILAKLNVEPFGEAGEQFDPNLHEAMLHEENEELGESVITEVYRKGYKKGDKIIRHALVKVAN